jgi:serine/threonine protein kinase/tetratricopeptide (TPR) repeat protein
MPDRRDSDVTPTPPGAIIGHYEILAELGRGGMGVLYRARDQRLGRVVALKRPYAPGVVQRQRFEREARAAAQLAHPHIVPIFEVLEQDGVPWIAMELVEGRSLRSLLDLGEALPLPEILRHAEGLAGALQAAHARGILHRDVNPKNVMITTEGRAVLTDFGLARVNRDSSADTDSTDTQENDVTRAGSVLGTPGYMSPEQALGRPADPRSDLFCLGAVLYEMCTRTRAFSASDTGSALDAVLHRDPPAVALCRKDCPPELERIVRKLLAKDAVDRYQNAGDVGADLRALRRQIEWERYGSGAYSTGRSTARSLDRFTRTRPRTRLLATGISLIAILGATAMLWPRTSGPVAFNERDWIVIADIENDTGESVFDRTLQESLKATLSQSTYVNVLPDERVVEALSRMKRARETPITAHVAREIVEREGARAFLTGAIRNIGKTYRVMIILQDAEGRVLHSEGQTFSSPSDFLSTIDRVAERIRGRLGESLSQMEQRRVPLELATTSSLDALRLYSVARRFHRTGDLTAATSALKESLAVDPEFALAHARLADAYVIRGESAAAVREYSRAFELSSSVTMRERLFIAARHHQAQEKYVEASESLRTLTSMYPDDQGAHHALALAYDSLGLREKAIAELQEVLRLDPHDRSASGNLVLLLASANRERDAIEAFESYERAGIASPYVRWGLGLALLGLGRFAEARIEFSRMEEAGAPYDSLARFNGARVDIVEGRWSSAAGQLQQNDVLNRDNKHQVLGALSRELQSTLLWLRKDIRGAQRELSLLLSEDDSVLRASDLRFAGALLARMGDVAGSRQVLERLRRLPGVDTSAVGRRSVHIVEGEIALTENRLRDAEDSFTAAQAALPHYAALQGLARVHVARREWQKAVDAWGRVIASRGEILRYGFPADWCLAEFELAEAHRQAGNRAEARAHYGRFVELWKDADSSPMLERARREMNGTPVAYTGRAASPTANN